MHWIYKNTLLLLNVVIIHLSVWTMRKAFHVIFPPYMQKCNTEWNMSIMGWVCGFLSHLSKSRCVRFSPFRGVCPVVELTGLGSLCLSKNRGVPRMCVGAVESCEKSGNFREIKT